MGEKKIAITCGDPAGVGPEIVESWAKTLSQDEIAKYVLIGPSSWLAQECFSRFAKAEVGERDFERRPGKPSVAAAEIARLALELSAQGCIDGFWSGVVTLPVSKEWIQKVGFTYPGQTEFFADRWTGEPTMAFAGGELKVVLATWHIPFAEVPGALTEACLAQAVERAHLLGTRLGVAEPRIGVCGLNPHAGEKGILGKEEFALNRYLDNLRSQYPSLSPCLPADTVFWRQRQGDFDVVVALYHDQGLAPLKTLEFDQSVNITLGLPWIRTSPDHGTGYDIAGKGVASSRSFLRALEMADLLL